MSLFRKDRDAVNDVFQATMQANRLLIGVLLAHADKRTIAHCMDVIETAEKQAMLPTEDKRKLRRDAMTADLMRKLVEDAT